MAVDNDDVALGVQALAWLSTQDDLVDRFCALTGLAPDAIRARATEPALLAALLDFLGYDDATFAACAEALSVPPERLADAARRLG